MLKLKNAVARFIADEEGLTTVEYAIAGGVIAAGVVALFTDIGTAVSTKMGELKNAITGTGA